MAEVKASPADRSRDRIDVAPRFTQADVIRLNNLFRGQDAAETVANVLGAGLIGDTAIVSSFGAESAVLLHLVTRAAPDIPVLFLDRSEERRVGKGCVSTCRSRWSPYHKKKKESTNEKHCLQDIKRN